MERIIKKINIGEFRSKRMGMAPYVSTEGKYEGAHGPMGNYGQTCCDVSISGETYTYIELLKAYNKITQALRDAMILKRIMKGGEARYKISNENRWRHSWDEYELCTEEDVEIEDNGLYRVTNTGITEAEKLISVKDLDELLTLTNNPLGFCLFIDGQILGLLHLPINIEGDEVMSMIYYCQIPTELEWFEKNKLKAKGLSVWEKYRIEYVDEGGHKTMILFANLSDANFSDCFNVYETISDEHIGVIRKDGQTYTLLYNNGKVFTLNSLTEIERITKRGNIDCCAAKKWDKRGGDAMETFLRENLVLSTQWWDEMQSDKYSSGNTFNLPIFISQTYEQGGILTPYEGETGDTIPSGTGWADTSGITAESKLYTLQRKERTYDDYGNIAPFFLNESGETEICFVTGQTFNEYITDNGQLIADTISEIIPSGDTIYFHYILGATLASSGNTWTIVPNTGIHYEESYPITEEIYPNPINGETGITYTNIAFDKQIETIYNSDFKLSKDGTISNIVGYVKGEIWDTPDVVTEPLFKEEYLGKSVETPQVDVDVTIERGLASVYEKYSKLGECSSFKDIEYYGNGYFLQEEQ